VAEATAAGVVAVAAAITFAFMRPDVLAACCNLDQFDFSSSSNGESLQRISGCLSMVFFNSGLTVGCSSTDGWIISLVTSSKPVGYARVMLWARVNIPVLELTVDLVQS
jgi:hypothetical protein